MADYGEVINTRRLDSNNLVRRIGVTYQVNHPLGDNFLLSKEGERDTTYGFFRTGTIQTGVGYDLVTIIFEDLKIGSGQNSVRKFTFRSNVISLPLERKTTTDNGTEKWKPTWNYNIVKAKGESGTVPVSSFEAAETLEAANSLDPGQFKKSNQGISTNEVIERTCDKPGQQAFLFPSSVVVEHVYTKADSILNGECGTVGWLSAPAQTFGLSTTVTKWLKQSSVAKKYNDWWEITQEYLYAPEGWDTDLYPEV